MAERQEGKPIPSPKDTLTVALSLAKAGWPVFPVKLIPVVRADGTKATDKRPTVKWLEGATTDLEQVATWWGSEFPDAWVGVHAARSGIVVVDLDLAKEGDGTGAANLKAEGYDLPKTFRYKTRSGGTHHVYAAPEGKRLTIARDHPVKLVDIRAGHGLMVYYGPVLTETPTLAAAPSWSILELETTKGKGADRGGDGDIEHWLGRTLPGKPTKALRELVKGVDANALDHDGMLAMVTGIVKLASDRGAQSVYLETRADYLKGRPDRARDWDNAAKGSIGQLGTPPATLEITRAERQSIKERNSPTAIAEVEATRKAEFRVAKIDERADATNPVVGNRDLTDAALAEEVAHALRHQWAHVGGVGILRYNDVVWQAVDEALLIETVRRLVRGIRAEETKAAILRGDKRREDEARGIESRNRVVAIARFASGIMLERAPKLDNDPDVLNTPTGVVDLRTGKMRGRKPGDYFTKVTAAVYEPGATSADWRAGLKAVPKSTRRWLQVRLGQSAVGRISKDKAIPFFLGGGDNGKSVIVGGVRNALGDYAVTVPERLLLGSDNDHPTDIMTLEGARFAVFEELPRGGRLNAQRIKLLAGTNTLSGRRMRQDFHSFNATHTLVGATNHLPMITDVDDAIWARVAPVPFPYKFVPPYRKAADDDPGAPGPRPGSNEREGDEGLRDRLAEPWSPADPAVLAWLIEGAVRSYKGVPAKPAEVLAAWEEWRGDADPVLGFVRDHIDLAEGVAIAATDLYAEFGRYLEGRGQQRWSDQLIATSFAGHSSLGNVVKRQVLFGGKLTASRPSFSLRPIPPRSMAWVGIKFRTTDHVVSEAEHDATVLSDLGKRMSS